MSGEIPRRKPLGFRVEPGPTFDANAAIKELASVAKTEAWRPLAERAVVALESIAASLKAKGGGP